MVAAPAPAADEQQLRTLADEVLAWRVAREPYIAMMRGAAVQDLQHYDPATAEADAAFARERLPRLRAIDRNRLPEALRALRGVLEQDLVDRAAADRHYWLGLLVTPYLGGDIHNEVQQVLRAQPLASAADGANYLRLVRAYARVLDEMHAKTDGQRQRGILVARAAIPGARKLLVGLRASVATSIVPTPERMAKLDAAAARQLARDVQQLVRTSILPRIDALAAQLDADYFAAAPEAVGLAQYPGGREYYRALVRHYVGDDLDPREIHAIGQRSVDQLNERLAAIRQQVGFTGTRAEFHRMLRSDPRWLAATPADVAERYEGFLRRIEPKLPQYFRRLPAAPFGVQRLDPRDEAGMTYGRYQPPTPAEPRGLYRFNGSDLASRTMVGAQHLIYHELMPGHHLQLGLQRELRDVHPLQTLGGTAAYVEGWAEYAAGLGEEMGLYEPYDLYGHYLMQLFLAVRLVVDTGMNELGWSLQQARDYMGEQLLEGAPQIESESLRYSTDIPGQALGYALGFQRFVALRHRAERALGARFELPAFHEAMLANGAVPLPVLDGQADDHILRASDGQAARHIAAVNVATLVIPGRKPAQVWTALLDRSNWMDGVLESKLLRGAPGVTGSRMLYTMGRGDGRSSQRFEETLLAVPGERLVLRASPADADTTVAIADFRLQPVAGGTRIELSTYWWENAEQMMAIDELDRLEATYRGATQGAIEGYLARLRGRLETRH